MEQINQNEIVGGPEQRSKGPTISAIIIVIILILGGAYLLLSKDNGTEVKPPEGGLTSGSATGENSLTTTPDPTDVSDLEAQANTESPDFLNADVSALEVELQ